MSNSPGKILNKWLTLKKKFEEHKKFKEMKDGQRQKLAIRNGLKALTQFTPTQLQTRDGQEEFVAKRNTVGKTLKKFCVNLKVSKEGEAKVREDFLKKVKQLTVVVNRLDPTTADLSPIAESANEPVNDLDTVDTNALEQEMDRGDDEEVTAPTDTRPADQRFKEVLKDARDMYLRLNQLDRGRGQHLLGLINEAVTHGKNQKYEQGIAVLKEVVASLQLELGAGTEKPKPTVVPYESTDTWKGRIQLDRCKFGRPLAKGGQGQVLLLESTDPNAPPLLGKVPLMDDDMDMGLGMPMREDNKYLQEMKREARYYEKIGDHPNIAKCMGVQKVGGSDTLVLEAIEGKDMSKVLDGMRARYERGQLSHEQFWGAMQFTMLQTLKALAHMETKGIVHNDIKPQNIMLDAKTGDVKIIDMGGCSETGGNKIAYTNGFVAPDLWKHGKVDGKSDVFSVGSTAYKVGEGRTFGYKDPNFWKGDTKQAIKEYGTGAKGDALEQGGSSQVDAKGERRKVAGRFDAETSYTDFVKRMMNPDKSQRPTATEALDLPFLAESILDEESIKQVIMDHLQPKPETEPAPKSPEDKAQGKKIDKALSTLSSLEKAGQKMLTDATTALDTVRKLRSTPTANDKDRAKIQEQLRKLGQNNAKIVIAMNKWTAKNEGQIQVLKTLRDGIADPVAWEAYDLKIEKGAERLTECGQSLSAILEKIKGQVEGTEPAPTIKDVDTMLRDTDLKVRDAAQLRQHLAALVEVARRNASVFQEASKQPRLTTELRNAYDERKAKYLETLGVLAGKGETMSGKFTTMIEEVQNLAALWKETPMPSGSQKKQVLDGLKNLLAEQKSLRDAQEELKRVKIQVASDLRAYG